MKYVVFVIIPHVFAKQKVSVVYYCTTYTLHFNNLLFNSTHQNMFKVLKNKYIQYYKPLQSKIKISTLHYISKTVWDFRRTFAINLKLGFQNVQFQTCQEIH
jgi:hypothetical protein